MSETGKILKQAFELLESYLDENRRGEVPVVVYRPAQELRGQVDLGLDEEGVPADRLVPLLEDYLRNSVRTGHKDFLNQLYGGFLLPAWLGDAFGALANSSMYTYEVAPLATLMELELVRKMNAHLGYREGEGIFCTGGSNANLLAMLCARDRAFPHVRTEGYRGGENPVLFISEHAHYSFAKAALQLGIGTGNVVKIPADDDGRMIPGELDAAVQARREAGSTPFFVAATAGTTVTGSFDPIRELRRVSRRHGLWLHVDGSWGGPVILSRKHRRLLDGVEESDSFTWDAHKMMGVPLICTAFLTSRKGALERSCALEKPKETEYLFHADEDAGFNLGRNSLQCGRRIDALKLWLAWKHLGDAGFERRVDHLFDLARYADARVAADPDLVSAAPLQSLNVCFRYDPGPGQDPDRFNLELRERLRKSGRCFINYAGVDGKVALRLVFPNPDLTEPEIDRIFQTIHAEAEKLLAHFMHVGP